MTATATGGSSASSRPGKLDVSAETETSFERLARLNRHRTIDVSALIRIFLHVFNHPSPAPISNLISIDSQDWLCAQYGPRAGKTSLSPLPTQKGRSRSGFQPAPAPFVHRYNSLGHLERGQDQGSGESGAMKGTEARITSWWTGRRGLTGYLLAWGRNPTMRRAGMMTLSRVCRQAGCNWYRRIPR